MYLIFIKSFWIIFFISFIGCSSQSKFIKSDLTNTNSQNTNIPNKKPYKLKHKIEEPKEASLTYSQNIESKNETSLEEEEYNYFQERIIKGDTVLLNDPALQNRIQGIGDHLLKISGYSGPKIKFLIAVDPSLNAWVGGNKTIYITTGMFDFLEGGKNQYDSNHKEILSTVLSGILAHEVVHIMEKHPFKHFEEKRQDLYKMQVTEWMLSVALTVLAAKLGAAHLPTTSVNNLYPEIAKLQRLQNLMNWSNAVQPVTSAVGGKLASITWGRILAGYDIDIENFTDEKALKTLLNKDPDYPQRGLRKFLERIIRIQNDIKNKTKK
jgi:hypothetical protein